MQKISTWVLMLCLTLSGAWCFAHGAARTENWKGRDGTPIDVIEMASHTGLDKSSAIVLTIDGHPFIYKKLETTYHQQYFWRCSV